MNSEELEQSLRTEFESYLKDVFSEIKREVSGFQERLDSEFKEHRSRVDAALEELAEKFSAERKLEDRFTDTVTEHLRLAKDEGARITAMAIAEAEELREEHMASLAPGPPDYSGLRNAVSDISSKTSQADILKSLVNHAAEYTARGAFFIVKNEHLVGWRVFGLEDHPEPDVVRDVYFPLSSDTALSKAVNSLSTVSGLGSGYDSVMYLDRLGFNDPKSMYAVPLVARGRGVAVLYADAGENGGSVNIEAIETLVQVAGLTVELLAAAPGSHVPAAFAPAGAEHESTSADYEWREVDHEPEREPEQFEAAETEAVSEAPDAGSEPEEAATGFSFAPAAGEEVFAGKSESETETGELEPVTQAETAEWDSTGEDFAEEFEPADEPLSAEQRFEAEVEELYEVSESVEYVEPEFAEAEAAEDSDESVEVVYEDGVTEEQPETSFDFAASPVQEAEPEEASSESFEYASLEEEAEKAEAEFEAVEETAEEPEPVAETVGVVSEQAAVAESAVPVRPRCGDRNIDLPIDVPESERQYHNAARRFARLLVSEIKLYNENKVTEGCEAHDLYDRLKEAIDRSREMYEKRVHGPVAETFDYFDYELVNNLAQGDKSKLGETYPGSKI